MALINNKENLTVDIGDLPDNIRNYINGLTKDFWQRDKDKYFDDTGRRIVNIKEDDLLSMFFREFLWDVAGKIRKESIDENEKEFYMDWFFSEFGQKYIRTFFRDQITKEHSRSIPSDAITEKQASYLKSLIRGTRDKCIVRVDMEYLGKQEASKLIDFLKSLKEGNTKSIDPMIQDIVELKGADIS